jgi:hypothetical protein
MYAKQDGLDAVLQLVHVNGYGVYSMYEVPVPPNVPTAESVRKCTGARTCSTFESDRRRLNHSVTCDL